MRKILFLVIIISACNSQKSKFIIESCYPVDLKKKCSHEKIINDIVSTYYESNEKIYGIEISTPTFNSILVFSDTDRPKSFRLNYQNGRIDRFKAQEMNIIKEINIDRFTDLMESDNEEQITVSKFSVYNFYKFNNSKLVYKKSIVNRKMNEDLMIKNNLSKIFDLLNTFDDKRKPCR